MKLNMFFLSFIFYATIYCQNDSKIYLDVKIIGKADYVNILTEFFVSTSNVTDRKGFNDLISNDSLLLLTLNDTINRVYFHEDLVENKIQVLTKGYKYVIPINEEFEIEIELVSINLSPIFKKYYKALGIPIFYLKDENIFYNILKTNHIRLAG